jgi:hypothetical protein
MTALMPRDFFKWLIGHGFLPDHRWCSFPFWIIGQTTDGQDAFAEECGPHSGL